MSETKGLFVKLAEVMGAVERVEKRGRNEFHKYDYATEADIVEAVRKALAERHVMLLPSIREATVNGTLTTLSLVFTFVDGDTGETHSCDWIGCGDDKGDKGAYKAMTGAVKYFLLKTFLIPTGDDPEGDKGTDERARDAAPRPQQTVRTNGHGPQKAAAAKSANGLMSDAQRAVIVRLYEEKQGITEAEIINVIPDWPHISSAAAGLQIAQLQKQK